MEPGFGELFGSSESVGGFDFDVGGDAHAFPIGDAVRIGDADFGNTDAVVVVDAMKCTDVGGSAGGLADDGGALEHFEVVGELLRGGEGEGRGEDVDGLAGEQTAGDRRLREGGRVGRLFWVVP